MLVSESWILIDEYRMLVNQSRMLVVKHVRFIQASLSLIRE